MALVCPKCGEKNLDGSKMCGMCGDMLPKAPTPKVVTPRPNAPRGPAPQQTRPANAPGVPPTPRQTMAPQRKQAVYLDYAGFWLRVAATIIDVLVLLPVIFPIMIVVGIGAFLASIFGGSGKLSTVSAMQMLLIPAGITWLYRALMESSLIQATVGKLACGLKVTDLEGNRISFGRSTIRFIGLQAVYLLGATATIFTGIGLIDKITQWYPLLCCLAVGMSDLKQGIHDSIAGTVVVKKERPIVPKQ